VSAELSVVVEDLVASGCGLCFCKGSLVIVTTSKLFVVFVVVVVEPSVSNSVLKIQTLEDLKSMILNRDLKSNFA
jgi:hypothetical protein